MRFRMDAASMVAALVIASIGTWPASRVEAVQFELVPPAGSARFGQHVVLLPNGQIVVTDPFASASGPAGPVANAGAVHLFRADGSRIATLRGSLPNDRVGSGGVTVLANGHYVARSPDWSNGSQTQVGAVTWCDGASGCDGVVSPGNSIIGAHAGDFVGNGGIAPLPDGNYVVASPNWRNGAAADAGAATWADGAGPTSLVVSAQNSLVGSSVDDRVGQSGASSIRAFMDGSYLVVTPAWDRGLIPNAGAVTRCPAAADCRGTISAANSLVGSSENDFVGSRVLILPSGAYVVHSQAWDNGSVVDAGAATWCPASGCAGAVTPGNSLVGGSAGDRVGGGAEVVGAGNYVVLSPSWRNGADAGAGAVTWCPGTAGCTGLVTAVNSLVGNAGSEVGDYGVVQLANGHYVVPNPFWNGAENAVGAVTWCSGASGCTGPVSAANSLVGRASFELLGLYTTALANGHYVVAVPGWDNGATENVGAVTWCDGRSGCIGVQSVANSLVGSRTFDLVGSGGVTALANGHYVVASPSWDRGTLENAGAATWCDGRLGCTGSVGTPNSLVGSSHGDQVGEAATALADGDFVVTSTRWRNLLALEAGAATWCEGRSACIGRVDALNSLVGTQTGDRVGSGGVVALADGGYLVRSPLWDRGAIADAGAVAWADSTGGLRGAVSAANALVGSAANDQLGNALDENFLDTGGRPLVLSTGDWAMRHPQWDNGTQANAGAVTFGFGDGTTVGGIQPAHSVLGTAGQVGDARNALPFAVDADRRFLIVGEPLGNRAVVLRPGPTTTTSIVADGPDPSAPGESVSITATVSSIIAPTVGRVRIAADSGESCVADAPTATSPTTADFTCTITFTAVGARALRAEHFGTRSHGYSLSAPEPHAVVAEPVFANGFE